MNIEQQKKYGLRIACSATGVESSVLCRTDHIVSLSGPSDR